MTLKSTLLLFTGIGLLSLPAFAAPQNAPDPEEIAAQRARGTLQAAENLRATGNIPGAIALYRDIAAKEDGETSAHVILAGLYRKSGNPAEAVAVMREAQKRKPSDEDVLAGLGYALIEAGEYQEAVNVFDMLTAVNNDSLAGYNGKAVAFDKAGNHTAAQEIYQKALRLSPGSATIQNNLALSMIMNNQPDTAITILEPLVQKPNATPMMRHNLALAYGIKGNSKRARELNLMDMKPEEAEENQRFYQHYAQMLKKQQLDALSPQMQAVMPSAQDDDDTQPVDLKPAAGTPKPAPRPLKQADVPAFKPMPAEPVQEKQSAPASDGKFLGHDATHSYPTAPRN